LGPKIGKNSFIRRVYSFFSRPAYISRSNIANILLIALVLDPNFAKYNNSSYHEAGYDAYVTGFTFLRLVAFMLHETGRSWFVRMSMISMIWII